MLHAMPEWAECLPCFPLLAFPLGVTLLMPQHSRARLEAPVAPCQPSCGGANAKLYRGQDVMHAVVLHCMISMHVVNVLLSMYGQDPMLIRWCDASICQACIACILLMSDHEHVVEGQSSASDRLMCWSLRIRIHAPSRVRSSDDDQCMMC